MTIKTEDLLVTLRLLLDNKFDGFYASFTNKSVDKIRFLQQGLNLVKQGWNEEFEALNKDDQTNHFFLTSCYNIFKKPNRLFKHTHLTEEDKQILYLFTRLAIFKRIVNIYIQYQKYFSKHLNSDVINDITTVKQILKNEFNRLPLVQERKVVFAGQTINSLLDLERLVEREERVAYLDIDKIKKLMVPLMLDFISVWSILYLSKNKDVLPESRDSILNMLAVMMIISSTYLLYQMVPANIAVFRLMFFNRREAQVDIENNHRPSVNHKDLRKFFLTSDKKIKSLQNIVTTHHCDNSVKKRT